MFVCHCLALTDREIGEAIAAGARDLDEIGRYCGAGLTCGGCCPLLEELLEQWAAAAAGETSAAIPTDLVEVARTRRDRLADLPVGQRQTMTDEHRWPR